MARTTEIAWTDATWNPIRGCSRVSAGCENCYAERMAGRFCDAGQPYDGLVRRVGKGARWTGEVRMVQEHLDDPLRWTKPRRVFVNSMSDLFHESLSNEQIASVFGVIAAAPRHAFQVLTKRATRMREWFAWVASVAAENGETAVDVCLRYAKHRCQHKALRGPLEFHTWPLMNVWLGVSVEDQDAADERVPELLRCPADVRWLSVEPMLGPVDISPWLYGVCAEHDASMGGPGIQHCKGHGESWSPLNLHWVVIGGESGPGARPMETWWVERLMEQCSEDDVAVFLKQLGAAPMSHGKRMYLMDKAGRRMDEWPTHLRVREWPRCV